MIFCFCGTGLPNVVSNLPLVDKNPVALYGRLEDNGVWRTRMLCSPRCVPRPRMPQT